MSTNCKISDRSVLVENGIDIIQVVIGVLIARIVVVWMDVLVHYVNWITYGDDDLHEEYRKFRSRWRSALLSTVVIVVVIIILYSWHKRYRQGYAKSK